MKNRDELEGKVPPELTPQKYPKGEMSGEVDYAEGADVTDQHAAIAREKPEPVLRASGDEGVNVFPMWLLVLCGLAIFWAGGYLFLFSGAFSGSIFNERRWEPAILFASGPGAGPAEDEDGPSQVELGEIYYKQNCQACHQPSGTGMAGQFPPLAGTEWVVGSEKRLAGIVLHGLTGPITIDGQRQSYVGVMQGWRGTLSNEKIAAILTYIRQAWGNSAGPITTEKIAAAHEELGARTTPWTEEELLQIPEGESLPGGDGGEEGAQPEGSDASAAEAGAAS